MAMNGVATASQTRASRGRFERMWGSDVRRRFTENKLGTFALIWLIVVVIASFTSPLWSQDPNLANVVQKFQPPSAEHWFGTDHLGRDILARTMVGGQVSLGTAAVATLVAMLIGFAVGTLTGYRGGVVDEVLSRIFDILTTFPTLLLGIIIIVALGPSLPSVMLAVAMSYVPLYGRLFRAGALSVKNLEYVQAVQSLGLPPFWIVVRHVVPNIIVPILVISAGAIGRAALAEAGLSFLGAGVQPPTASWGNMMAEGQPFLQIYPWFPVIPGTILTSVTIAFSFVGDALRDAFDIRQSAAGKDV